MAAGPPTRSATSPAATSAIRATTSWRRGSARTANMSRSRRTSARHWTARRKRSTRAWLRSSTSRPTTAPGRRPCASPITKPESSLHRAGGGAASTALSLLREGAADLAPIFDRVFLARQDLDRDLGVAGVAQLREALFQLARGCGEACRADQRGGDERALVGLDEHQMAAVVFEIGRALRPELPRERDIALDCVGDGG